MDFVYLTMQGSLARWQNYLTQKSVQPKIFYTLKIDVKGNQHMHYQSHRAEFEVNSNLLRLSDTSILELNFAFFHDGDAVVWDVASVWVGEGPHSKNSIIAWRKTEPTSDLPDGFQDDWHKVQNREFPFNATILSEDGLTRILTTSSAPGEVGGAKVNYALRVELEGTQPQDAMKKKLDVLQHSFKQLEH